MDENEIPDPPPAADSAQPPGYSDEGWSAAELADILDHLPASVILLDPDGRIRYLNATELKRIGRPGQDVTGRTLEQLYGVDMLEYERERIQRAVSGEPSRFTWSKALPHGRTANFDCHLVGLPADVFPTPTLLLVTMDVSDQIASKTLDHDLRPYVLGVREQLARQLEGAVAVRIEQVCDELSAAGHRVAHRAPSTAQALDQAAQLTVAALEYLRKMLHSRGGVESIAEFPAAVAWLSDEAEAALGFAPHLKVRGPVERMSVALAEDVLAVLAEALSNVARHANAAEAVAAIAVTTDHVSVTVADDGRGGVRAGAGNGTRNLSARAARWGGECAWGPKAPRGTVLEWRVPLSMPASTGGPRPGRNHRDPTYQLSGDLRQLSAGQSLAILDSIPEGCSALNREEYIGFANLTAVEWLGYEHRCEVVGKRISDLLPPRIEIPTRAFVRGALDGVTQRVERTTEDGHGHPKHVYSTYAPQFLAEEVVGLLMYMHDISERIDARDENLLAARTGAAIQERRRLAENLHDIVIQHLFAAGLRLETELQAHRTADGAHPESAAALHSAINQVDSAIASTRESIAMLRVLPQTTQRP